tara:strand:+ start:54 stop:326 length:273 start_codon:yes stop_codon:yes gene_type:complete
MKELKTKIMKVGNKVKLIKNDAGSCNSIGDIGIISEVDLEDDTCRVVVDGVDPKCGNWSIFEDLEIVKEEEITYSKKELKKLFNKFLKTL